MRIGGFKVSAIQQNHPKQKHHVPPTCPSLRHLPPLAMTVSERAKVAFLSWEVHWAQFMDVLSRNWNTYIILHLCAWFPQRGSDSISTILTVLTLYDASQSTPCSSSSHFLSIFGTSKDWGQDVIGSELVILSKKIHASMVLIDKVTELTRQTKQPGRWLCLRTSFSPRSASWPGGHIPDSWTNQIVRDFAKS